MAFTKKQKTDMLVQYQDWATRSQAVFMLEFNKMSQKDIDALRAKAREAGGELHIVKNTLFSIALDQLGYDHGKLLENTTLVGFAFGDAPALAKIVNDAAKSNIFKVKGGLLDKKEINPAQVKALADLPPLPVIRAQLLGVFQAPAAKLVRTIAEPGRSIAGVIKAYSEAPAAA